jgi:HlyD family secretion protein
MRRAYVTVLMLVAFVTVWAARERHPSEPVQVTTAAVTRGPIVRRVIAVGTLQALRTVDIGAQVSGTVQSLSADFNSIVRKDEVIAKLDPALFEASLREAQAGLQRSRASLAQAEADERGLHVGVEDATAKLTRAQSLAAGSLIPAADLDAARAVASEADADFESGASRVQQAAAEVAQAQAAVNQATIDLDRTVIRSPIDGIVVARSVDVGQTVAAAVQAPVLFTLATDLSHMQVSVEIDESDVAGIREGQPVTFEVESYPDDTFAGTVSQLRLQPTTANGTVSYTLMVDVSNPDDRLRPGMTATVAVSGSRRDDVLRIPNNALAFRPSLDVLSAVAQPADATTPTTDAFSDPTNRRVWRFDGKQFIAVPIVVGLSDAQWTELAHGALGAGDTLVTTAAVTP